MTEVRIKGAEALVSMLRTFGANYPKEVARSMSIWGRENLLPALKKAAPVGKNPDKRDTGHLWQAIRVFATARQEGPQLHAVAGTESAIFTEFGTKPHAINPRFKKALRIPHAEGGYTFIGPRLFNGRMLVRSSGGGVGQSARAWGPAVWHPGTKAQNWFFPTIEKLLPGMESALQEDIGKAVDKAFANRPSK